MVSFYLRVILSATLTNMPCKARDNLRPISFLLFCFAGCIPEDLAALTKLEQLVLYSNRLSGEERVTETSMIAVHATIMNAFARGLDDMV